MALALGSTEIPQLGVFAGWNSIQKKIKMRDRSLSTLVYDFYVQDGQATLSAELSVLEADEGEAGGMENQEDT